MKRILALLPCLALQAHAQVNQKGEWQFPTSAKTYCVDLEQNIVSVYKAMVENNRKAANPDWTGDRQNAYKMGEAQKAAVKDYEDSWHKMDCAAILYGKK